MHLRTAALPVALLLALAGCGGDSTPTAAAPRASAPLVPLPVSSPAAPTVAAVDWDAPAAADLRHGWSLGPCQGDAPLVCFSYDGQERGVAEVATFPGGTNATVTGVLAEGGTPQQALAAHAAEHLASMRDDRLRGCGADYAFVADAPRAMTADGAPAVKTAFEGGRPGGAPTERIVRWVGLRGDAIVSVVVHATDEGACAAGLGGDLSTADLADLETVLDELFSVSPLPAVAAA